MPIAQKPRRTAVLLALAAAMYGAQPPWEKPAKSWTPDDVAALLNASPWAVQTEANMEDPRDAIEERPAGPPDTGGTGMVRSTGGPAHWGGEPGHNRMGRLATIPVTVRWESALPIREAQKERAAPADSYVISISGLIPVNLYRSAGKPRTTSSSDGAVDARNPEEVLETFMAYSKIALKGSSELKPENVKLDPATGVVRIFFPRRSGLDSGQKEALFITRFGKLNVRAKFRFSSMKYHGTIEL